MRKGTGKQITALVLATLLLAPTTAYAQDVEPVILEDTEASTEASTESATTASTETVTEVDTAAEATTETLTTEAMTEETINQETAAMNREDVRKFVERMYTICLGRTADTAGVSYWTDTLMNKEKTAAEVGYGFVFSDEYKNKNAKDDAFVEMLYNVFMDRKSDPEGKAYWVSLLQKGYSRRYVYRKFAHSQEFSDICKDYKITRGVITLDSERDRWPELTEYVGRLYDKALDRHPDDAGMNWWCTNIKNHTMTPVAAAESFILSPEFEAKNLNNEEYIKVLYRTFMGREYDQDGMNYWLGRINSGESRRTILRSFAGCPEFAAIAAKAGISEETVTVYKPGEGHWENDIWVWGKGEYITYRPSDYYLPWDYICDQVNAMLKSDYPNAIIGTHYEDGTYSNSWFTMDDYDGTPDSIWTIEGRIEDSYRSIKHDLDAFGVSAETTSPMGMFIQSIETIVNDEGWTDGRRRIYTINYR